jgi:nitroreductase
MDITEAIKARSSIRAFLSKPVSNEILKNILELSSAAPSGKNTQPWHVAVVTGATQHKISEALLQAFHNKEKPHPDYQYYPHPLPPIFEKRAVECGMALYGALKVDRHDDATRLEQWARNYQFFDAPACILIFVDDFATEGSFMDAGMFMQNIMLAALEFDLGTCPQASLAGYPDLVKNILSEPFQDKLLIGGISIGYPDWKHPVNQYRTTREDVHSFVKLYS